MKVRTLLITLCLGCCSFVQGQDYARHFELIHEAFRLYFSSEYQEAGAKFTEAFEALGDSGSVHARFNAACAWAKAGEADSAFAQLERLTTKNNFTDLDQITAESALASLHDDVRWNGLLDTIRTSKEKAEANFDQELIAKLDSVYERDQDGRSRLDAVRKEYGRDSNESRALWDQINRMDSLNLIEVEKILDERGWLGPDIIGEQGSSTLFLVIQHADLAAQEKYLPLLREAVKQGNAERDELALLEDRVALDQGKKQIYGSQIRHNPVTDEHHVRPLIDPDHVNERRYKVGLGPLEDYVEIWGIIWDAEVYKEKLPEYEEQEGW